MARKRLGELLLERRVIDRAQLEKALAYQRQTGQRLGAALVTLGFMTEAQLCEALAQALGLNAVRMPPDNLDWEALHLLRTRFCEANDLFPLSVQDLSNNRRALTVAMADPLNMPAIEEIEFTTGMKVTPVIAPLSGIRAAIRKYYLKQSDAPADGSMQVVHPGGEMKVVQGEAEPDALPDIDPTAVQEVTERTALADLIRDRDEQRKKKRAAGASLNSDLDYLFGGGADRSEVAFEKLESKFWALLRIMAKKGLITRDDFLNELAEDD